MASSTRTSPVEANNALTTVRTRRAVARSAPERVDRTVNR